MASSTAASSGHSIAKGDEAQIGFHDRTVSPRTSVPVTVIDIDQVERSRNPGDIDIEAETSKLKDEELVRGDVVIRDGAEDNMNRFVDSEVD